MWIYIWLLVDDGVFLGVDFMVFGVFGELGVFFGGDVSVSLVIVFDEFFQYDGMSWYIDVQGEGFGSDDDFE